MGAKRVVQRATTLAIAVAVVGGVCVSKPADAAPKAETPPAIEVGSSKSLKVGDPAPSGDEPVEITGIRSEYSTTYEMPDGSRQARLSAEPVNFKNADDNWQRIDNTLVPNDQGWSNRANSIKVQLPRSLGEPIGVNGPGLDAQLALVGPPAGAPEAGTNDAGATPSTTEVQPTAPAGSSEAVPGSSTPETAPSSTTSTAPPASSTTTSTTPPQPKPSEGKATEHQVTYDLGSGTELVYSAQARGLKELVQISSPKAQRSVTFELKGRGLTVAAGESGEALISQNGKQIAWIPAPFAYDAAGNDGTAALKVEPIDGGARLTLVADDAFLDAPERAYPVTIDPSILFGGPLNSTDCYNSQASPTSRDCTSDFFRVGKDNATAVRNGFLVFPDVTNVVPADANVVGAKLKVQNYSVTGTGSITIQASRISNQWTTNLNWTKRNSTDNWTTAGGDFSSTYDDEAGSEVTIGSTAVGAVEFSLNQVAAGWVSHKFENRGVGLRWKSGTGNSANFRSSEYATSADQPVLFIDYRNRGGAAPPMSFEQYSLTDRQGLAVNRANTVAVIASTEMNIRGTGMDLNISRYYNTNGNNGPWTWSVGADNYLYETAAGSVQYFTGTGAAYLFVKNKLGDYSTPYGLNAKLTNTGSGNFTLTDNKSKVKTYFEPKGLYKVPVKIADRASTPNEITFAYTVVSGYPQLNTITDTQGRTVTVAWSSGHISSFTETAPSPDRVVSYTWSGSNLTVARDADNKDTTYGYDAQNRIDTITTPDSRITKLSYVNTTDDRIYQVKRVYNNGTGASYDTTFNQIPTSMSPSDAGYTEITDARSNQANAYYDSHDALTKYTDALGHDLEASQYDDNGDSTQLTDGLSAIFTAQYDTDRNLTQTQSPSSGGGATGARTVMTYGTGGDDWLMTSRSDLSSCDSYEYDTQGMIKDVYSGNAPGGYGTCAGATGGDQTHIARNANGTVDYIDPPSGSAGRIAYTYTSGNLTKTDFPSPLPDETYVVDASSRRTQVTDSKGQVTNFTYDNIDRVVQVTFNGDSTCSSWSTCIQYDYDDDGNLTQRVDNTGTTSFSYDKLGRPTGKQLPGGANACSTGGSAMTYAYDGVNNLTSTCDGQGTVTYTFDSGDRMTGLAEPGGSCTSSPKVKCTQFQYDDNNRRTKTTYPSSSAVEMNLEYLPGGQLKKAESKRGATVLTSYSYSYLSGSTDTSILQSLTNNVAGTSRYFRYDTHNRICWDAPASSANACSVQPTGGNKYTYDVNGNRKTRTTSGGTVTTYAYNNADQLCWRYTGTSANACALPPSGAVSYTYDNNGNQTASSAGMSGTYNSKDQMTGYTPEGGSAATYEYADVRQNERTKIDTTALSNGLQGLVRTKDASNNTVTWTYDNDGALVSQHRSVDSNAHYYYLNDGRGNTVGLIDDSGNLDNTYTYGVWGSVSASETVPNPWRYRGGYYDSSTSTKFGARYYNQDIGRFTQRDPSRSEANSYAYAGNDPVNQADPSGLSTCGDDSAGGLVDCIANPTSPNTTTSNVIGSLGGVSGIAATVGGCILGAIALSPVGAFLGGLVTIATLGTGAVAIPVGTVIGAVVGCGLGAGVPNLDF